MLNATECNQRSNLVGLVEVSRDQKIFYSCWLHSAGFTLGQLMDVVALSRVSSQLLKGVRAASHLDN